MWEKKELYLSNVKWRKRERQGAKVYVAQGVNIGRLVRNHIMRGNTQTLPVQQGSHIRQPVNRLNADVYWRH